MIGVDLICQIRRAYFEQRRPIKEIVRLLSVSRTTVRKVIRGQEALCAAPSFDGAPGEARLKSPSGPFTLNRITQSLSV